MSYELFAIADALGANNRESQRQAWLWHDRAQHLEAVNGIIQADKTRLARMLEDRDKRVAALERQLRQAQTAHAMAEGKSRTLAETSSALEAAQRENAALRADLESTRQELAATQADFRMHIAQSWFLNEAFVATMDHARALEDAVLALGGDVVPFPEFKRAEEALGRFKADGSGPIGKRLHALDAHMANWRQRAIARTEAARLAGNSTTPLEALKATNAALTEQVAKLERRLSRTEAAYKHAAADGAYFVEAYNALYQFGLMYEQHMRDAGVPVPDEEPEVPDIAAIYLKYGVPIDKASRMFGDDVADFEKAKARHAELVAAKLAEAEQTAAGEVAENAAETAPQDLGNTE